MRTGTTRLAALLCALGLTMAVAACGGGDSDDTAGGGDAAEAECPIGALTGDGEDGEAASGGPVEISVWYGGLSGKSKTVMTETVKAYNESQDRVKVTASDQGAAYTQVQDKFTQAIPDRIPNVVYSDGAHTQFLMDSGTIIPGGVCADEGVVPIDDLQPVVQAFYTLDGAFVPSAVNVSTPQFYYNKKQFEEAGIPTEPPGTIDEVRSLAEELKAAGLPDLEWPLSITVNPWYLETLLTGIGQDIVDNDNGHSGHATEAVFDTPETLAIVEELAQMYDDGLVAKVSNTPGQYDHYLNLAQGKSTMLFETSTAATTIEAFLGGNLSAEELAGGDLSQLSGSVTVVPGFGPMPGIEEPGQVMVSGGAFFVTNAGDELQQAAAMDFMRFMNELPQQVRWHIEGSYLPSNVDVADQPEVQEFYTSTIAGMSLQIAAEQLAAVPPENPGPIVGPEDEYTDILQTMLEGVFLSGSDPATALTEAEADLTAAIQEYNETNGF